MPKYGLFKNPYGFRILGSNYGTRWHLCVGHKLLLEAKKLIKDLQEVAQHLKILKASVRY